MRVHLKLATFPHGAVEVLIVDQLLGALTHETAQWGPLIRPVWELNVSVLSLRTMLACVGLEQSLVRDSGPERTI